MFDDFREWLSDNLRYLILFLAIILVVGAVGGAIVLIKGMEDKNENPVPSTQETVLESDTKADEDDVVEIPDTEQQSESSNELEEDAIPEVNDLVKQYYDGMSNQDIDGLKLVVDHLSDEGIAQIQQRGNYIENYGDIKVYTKTGPVENSYVVFAYYKIKFKNVDTLAPGLSSIYVCTNEEGRLYISTKDTEESVKDYISEIRQDEDVKELEQRINDEYTEARESDPNLQAVIEELEGKGEPIDDTSADSDQDISQDVQTNKVVVTTDICNVRADSRPDADLLGTLNPDEELTRVRILDNGWSEVKYLDGTGYILSDYLVEK
ncbi:MAG TPA: SH3 domain-containing protein [Candidatus Merdenecus merdavium]|nr:SH3 domain-containing protein [Candidatus Merdenecus merdavium]